MSKANNYKMADYVLSGGHEEGQCLVIAREHKENEPDMNRSQLRKIMEDHIFYAAYCALYGRAEARKKITEMLGEL